MKRFVAGLVIAFMLMGSSYSYVKASNWLDKTPFEGITIAEAGGSYDDTKGTNSKQSVEKSIEEGYKTIEIDISITSDDKAVCINGWTENTYDKLGLGNFKENPIMSYDDFMSSKINDKYDTLDARMIYQYVHDACYDGMYAKKPDTRFIIDFGDIEKKWDAFNSLKKFLKEFDNCIDHLTFKIYSNTMYNSFHMLRENSNYMYVIDSKEDVEDIDNILTFCSDKNFMAIQIKNSLITKDIVNKCHEYGLQVVSTTTNSEKKAKKLLTLGVDCIATNTISPDFGETTDK